MQTDIQAVRTLIGDQLSASFTDDEITSFNSLALVDGPGSEYFLSASIALRSLASIKGNNLQEISIGDFRDYSGRQQVASINATADAYFKLYTDTPAWAVIEEDVSDFNALIIIRNFVLRTNR